MSLRTSCTIFAPSLDANIASSEYFCILCKSLAGCPRRTHLALPATRRSTRLSTATLDGAQARTCRIHNACQELVGYRHELKVVFSDSNNIIFNDMNQKI